LPWQSPRKQLFTCAGLDFLAIWLAVGISNLLQQPDLLHPPAAVGVVGALYCTWSWLLGSYTVLRWPWLRLRLILQRLLLSALACWASLVLGCWLAGVGHGQLSLLNRDVLINVLAWQTLLALGIRLQLRVLIRATPKARWQLLTTPNHEQNIIREWQKNPFIRRPQLITPERFQQPAESDGKPIKMTALAVASEVKLNLSQRNLIKQLQTRGVLITTLEELAQRQLERLPPSLLPMDWLSFHELAWSDEFNLQRKLKRLADVVIASLLLVLCLPLLLLIGAAIWLEDRGPVLYLQTRTGWMGQSFLLIKLRTMRVVAPGAPTPWTRSNDSRITRVGTILRRTRIDELPQLLNVIRGEMSLIGPRPEQPHLDDELAASIPHYNKRYWMLPGLSGWAQVCGPAYPSSLEEAELKLSYDLFYLRNWSLGLDLLILAKTIKTLLKIRGV
jgi:lipopolysaccharide/colanic/teichoic acid biosynthesis glycosyltransferase